MTEYEEDSLTEDEYLNLKPGDELLFVGTTEDAYEFGLDNILKNNDRIKVKAKWEPGYYGFRIINRGQEDPYEWVLKQAWAPWETLQYI